MSQVIIHYWIVAILMCIAIYPVSLLLGFADIMTWRVLLECMAIGFTLHLCIVPLVCFCGQLVGQPELPEHDFYAVVCKVDSAVLIFLAFG